MPHDADKSSTDSQAPPAVWQWLVLSLILILGLAILTANAPPGWQRPGPTALWLSIVGGVFVGGIAVVNHVQNRLLIFSIAFAFVAVAIVGMTVERHRLYVESLAELYLGSPQPAKTDPFSHQLAPQAGAEALIEGVKAQRRKVFEAKRPFPVFLEFRVEPLGITEEPWPMVFWIGEILLGGLVGAFAAVTWHSWQTASQESISESNK